ncbi:glycosyltransferase [Halothece sp. PCC 7418]|uniref:glycosyltransferase n=1 Tax=Halothece sp. (strain PCC 7418) TaxID=65093 RepID=UPI00149469E7|nr:glycosyltransferase [Halothece sp. PCC 7418]
MNDFVVLGAIGLWRWSWLIFHALRSVAYRIWVFPRWRRKARHIPIATLPRFAIVIPTYKEKPWITDRVFRAIAREAQTLNSPLTLVPVTTAEENRAIAQILTEEDPSRNTVKLLNVSDPAQGKRGALVAGLEALHESGFPADGIVALMDGDSELMPGSIRNSLPFFRLFPKLGGLTTNEMPEVHGSYLFSEWLHLRFSQRHHYMCSHALSNKVLCLTGRCSFFRAEAALDPTFRGLLARDFLNDWLWGQFRFLSGDDKTTWYWLLREGYDMIYLPDVMVYTIETISGSLMSRAYQNIRRWSGNTLRNGTRALALGPHRTGFLTWLCVLDQGINMWTTLISPGLLVISLLLGNWIIASIIACWLVLTRCLYLLMVFWGRPSLLKLVHLPIMLFTQWWTALIKIFTRMNLSQQKWTNRHGNNKGGKNQLSWGQQVQKKSSQFLLYTQMCSFMIFLCWQWGMIEIGQDLPSWWKTRQLTAQPIPTTVVQAIDYGIIPNDGKDDAKALQTLMNNLPATGLVEVRLPLGEIELFQPLEVHRSQTLIIGEGRQGTILRSFLKPPVSAVLKVQPQPPQNSLADIELRDFTIEAANPDLNQLASSIHIEQLQGGALRNLSLQVGQNKALTLVETHKIRLEYINH